MARGFKQGSWVKTKVSIPDPPPNMGLPGPHRTPDGCAVGIFVPEHTPAPVLVDGVPHPGHAGDVVPAHVRIVTEHSGHNYTLPRWDAAEGALKFDLVTVAPEDCEPLDDTAHLPMGRKGVHHPEDEHHNADYKLPAHRTRLAREALAARQAEANPAAVEEPAPPPPAAPSPAAPAAPASVQGPVATVVTPTPAPPVPHPPAPGRAPVPPQQPQPRREA